MSSKQPKINGGGFGNTDDWTFDTKNIADISHCSVTYQRFFKEDVQQQSFLDKLYNELEKVGQNQIK